MNIHVFTIVSVNSDSLLNLQMLLQFYKRNHGVSIYIANSLLSNINNCGLHGKQNKYSTIRFSTRKLEPFVNSYLESTASPQRDNGVRLLLANL